MLIRYLHRTELDTEKWNTCVNNANGLIYAQAIYLDTMADHWDALVLNDYEVVMPLPWRKKYGIYYLYQPAFTAQLGVFGNDVTETQLKEMLDAIPAKFRYWDFSLNHQNLFDTTGYSMMQRSNFVLELNKPYEVLLANYRENIRRNIKRASVYGCEIKKDIPVNEVISIAMEQVQQKDVSANDFERFEMLYQKLKCKGSAITYSVVSKDKKLLASCVFFFANKRAYYILVGNHPNGRTLGASHALIDAFIKDHAGEDLLLDFEGSDLRNLAFFYSSFGAAEEKYAAIRLNKLPWWVRWLKPNK